MYEPFEAKCTSGITKVCRTPVFLPGEPQMILMVDNGDYIYITKEQAMKFFGLVEAQSNDDPRLVPLHK